MRKEVLERLRHWALHINNDILALYLCAKDPRVPWYAKAIAAVVAAYALSPIDLIPDFLPIIGYLDDLIIVPLGILLAVKLIPPEIMQEHRNTVASRQKGKPVSRSGAIIVLAIWLMIAAILIAIVAWDG